MDAEEIVRALGGRMTESGGMVRCPAHDDTSPSLHVTDANGRVLVHCHAGCSQDAVLDALMEARTRSSPGARRWRRLHRVLPTPHARLALALVALL